MPPARAGHRASHAEFLALVPDTSVTLVERCSGHDGTYAIKAETYEAAMKIARPVVRAVQSAAPATYGSDCPMAGRMIEHGLADGSKASHPISMLRRAYGSDDAQAQPRLSWALEEYAVQRPTFRQTIIAHKKLRRIALGAARHAAVRGLPHHGSTKCRRCCAPNASSSRPPSRKKFDTYNPLNSGWQQLEGDLPDRIRGCARARRGAGADAGCGTPCLAASGRSAAHLRLRQRRHGTYRARQDRSGAFSAVRTRRRPACRRTRRCGRYHRHRSRRTALPSHPCRPRVSAVLAQDLTPPTDGGRTP